MLLRVSRLSFWLAALAAAVALVIPTGWETTLTGFAALASVLAFFLWRSGLTQVRRSETAHALLPDAMPLTRAALDDAAAMVERCCAEARSFEAALHGVAHILKTELGALRVAVCRVMGYEDQHARVSELIEAAPGFCSAERRVHLQRSLLGRAIATQQETVDPSGAIVLPVLCRGDVVAAIELVGLQVSIDPYALTALLGLALEQLSRRAEPARAARPPGRGHSVRLGENA